MGSPLFIIGKVAMLPPVPGDAALPQDLIETLVGTRSRQQQTSMVGKDFKKKFLPIILPIISTATYKLGLLAYLAGRAG